MPHADDFSPGYFRMGIVKLARHLSCGLANYLDAANGCILMQLAVDELRLRGGQTASPAACSMSSSKASSCNINRFCIAQDLSAAQVISALFHRDAVDQIDRASRHPFKCLFTSRKPGHVGVLRPARIQSGSRRRCASCRNRPCGRRIRRPQGAGHGSAGISLSAHCSVHGRLLQRNKLIAQSAAPCSAARNAPTPLIRTGLPRHLPGSTRRRRRQARTPARPRRMSPTATT